MVYSYVLAASTGLYVAERIIELFENKTRVLTRGRTDHFIQNNHNIFRHNVHS